jgi:DNA invertase Pin-like site-specific DNA recombinase
MTRGKLTPALRCAIYTRVSTEHGLEQEFNSLDNQREAAEAYVKSQAHEGWRCLPTRYDDGGFSGGSIERPALQRLLGDIRARLIDVVVVYKVDRLTRSLTDFAKLVELFDEHGVSFVSVTQAFNTTTSMGRLTLNVLLSFAQFEREVTGERIRDKIAASKKKGIWMGGVVPLGYRVENRALHIVEDHAILIRRLFTSYLDFGSVGALKHQLDHSGLHVPERTDGAGRHGGGKPFSRGHLYKILSNPIYAGRLSHKGNSYEGQHQAIIDQGTWDKVQAQLASHAHHHKRQQLGSEHLLTGRIRDDRGHAMTPTHAQKGSRRYRYYVSQAVLQGKNDRGSIARVPAPEIEALVIAALRADRQVNPDLSDGDLIRNNVHRVTIHEGRIEIATHAEEDAPIHLPWSPPSAQRRRDIIVPDGSDPQLRPMKVEDRARILKAIATGRAWLDELVSERVGSTEALATRERCSERSIRMTLSLAFLSPKVVQAILAGRLPRGIGITHLAGLPASWSEQHSALGI